MRLLTYGCGFPHVRVEAENTILQQVSRWLISPSRLANWPALSQRQTAQGLEERRLGATIILGEIQYLIVGSSIILTGVGAFAALAINQQASNLVKHCIGYAAAWAVLAPAMGVYATCLLPHHTLSRNFILVKNLNIWLALGVFMFVVAAFRLLVAVILLLMS
jgi:hypothetical protein